MLPEELKGEYEPFILSDTASEEYKVVKYADRLAAYLKCVEEVKAGNSEFKKAKNSIGNERKKAEYPPREYFFKNFAAAFDLSLDELD